MTQAPNNERYLGSVLPRALAGLCPACGKARLFARFLKPVSHCPNCGEAWHHHEADDFPPYLVILLLGHLLIPTMAAVNMAFDVPYQVQMIFWPLFAAVLAFAMLQPVKGAVIGYQWSRRMHGFANADTDDGTRHDV